MARWRFFVIAMSVMYFKMVIMENEINNELLYVLAFLFPYYKNKNDIHIRPYSTSQYQFTILPWLLD